MATPRARTSPILAACVTVLLVLSATIAVRSWIQSRTEAHDRGRALDALRAVQSALSPGLGLADYAERLREIRAPVHGYLGARPRETRHRRAVADAMDAHLVAMTALVAGQGADPVNRGFEVRQRYGDLGQDRRALAAIEACPALKALVESKLRLGPYLDGWTVDETRGAILAIYPRTLWACAEFHLAIAEH
jgi:hypothetical protein